jgi:integrase
MSSLRWVADYPRPKDTSNRYNEERVRQFAIDFMDLPLRDMDRPTARRWAMANPGRLNSVSAMFTDAMNDGLIDHNPFRELRIPRSEGRKNITVLTEPELYKLADRALEVHGADYGVEFRALLLFAAHVGVRPGELMMLKGSSVHGRLLHVDWQRNKYGSVTRPKNGKPRVVTLPLQAREALADLGVRGPDEFLFRSKQGKPLSSGSLFYAWNPVRVADGRAGLDFYEVTRHYCATWLLESGAGFQDVAVQLGHEDGGLLVLKTYGHPSKDAARERLLALDGEVAPLRIVRGGDVAAQ